MSSLLTTIAFNVNDKILLVFQPPEHILKHSYIIFLMSFLVQLYVKFRLAQKMSITEKPPNFAVKFPIYTTIMTAFIIQRKKTASVMPLPSQ